MLVQKIAHFLKRNIFPTLLLSFSVVLCITNYIPGTWLSGWDTLHHEFNFLLYLKRDLFGVWRSYQGLGAVTVHSYSSDLPRQLILLFFSFFFPVNFLRYSYIFLTLLVGPLGLYFFLKKGIFRDSAKLTYQLAAFIGGLFYMLNLGALQQFHVPFEMFNAQYAFMPLTFLYALLYFREGRKRHLLLFILFTILLTPSAYAATLFYAYLVVFIMFFLTLLVLNSRNIRRQNFLKRAVFLVLTTLAINSYWMLPNLYFVATHGSEVSETKINYIFSEEAFLKNREFGGIEDAALIKNFLFGWQVYNSGSDNFEALMSVWDRHLRSPLALGVGFTFFGFAVLGLVLSFVRKSRELIAFSLLFLFALFFVMNSNPPLGFLFEFFRGQFSVFREAMRFPFAKFSVIYTFTYAVLVGFFISTFLFWVSTKAKLGRSYRAVQISITVLLTALLVYFYLPAFRGYLISPFVRIDIPSHYAELFEWFDEQPEEGRVAILPINSLWGWSYNRWGYQGSGFWQFGIKQPVLDRDFDRWSPHNEQYYREMSNAIYSEDLEQLESLLDKYQIKYVLLDMSAIAPEQDPSVLYFKETHNLLSRSNRFSTRKVFNDVEVYVVDSLNVHEGYFHSPEKFSRLQSSTQGYTKDFVYIDRGDYFASDGVGEDLGVSNYPNRGVDLIRDKVDTAVFDYQFPVSSLVQYPRYEQTLPFKVFTKREGSALEAKLVPYYLDEDHLSLYDAVRFEELKPGSIYALSLNIADVIGIEKTTDTTFVYRETVFLDGGRNADLTLYEVAGEEETSPVDASRLQLKPLLCSEFLDNQSYGVERVTLPASGFRLIARNSGVCTDVSVAGLVQAGGQTLPEADTPFLYEFVFDTDVSLVDNLKYCLKNEETGKCLEFEDFFALEKEVLSSHAVAFRLDAETSDLDVSRSVHNIRFRRYSPLKSEGIDPAEYYRRAEGLEGTFNLKALDALKKSLWVGGSRRIGKTCSTSSKENSVVAFRDEGSPALRYASLGGSGCDSFGLAGLNRKSAYLLNVTSKNESGLPMRLCVTNTSSRRCDVYTTLTSANEFTSETFLIPAMGEGYSLDVNLDNYSIGQVPTINSIKDLSIVPFPYGFATSYEEGSSDTIGNTLSIDSVREIFPFLYRVELAATTPLEEGSSGLLVFNQSYEEGWVAICTTGICNADHVLVNDWANGWTFGEGIYVGGSQGIVILFWPQLLQYLGFIFFGLFLVKIALFRRADSS